MKVKIMVESVYKFIELVGTSEKSWEDAVTTIIEKASKNLRDIRIAEVLKLDVRISDQKINLFRAQWIENKNQRK